MTCPRQEREELEKFWWVTSACAPPIPAAAAARRKRTRAHMLSARCRPHHALEGVPASQAQNAGLSPAGGRPLPHPAHAHAEVTRLARTVGRALRLNEGSVRGHRSRPRSRPHAVRPRRERALNEIYGPGFRHYEQSLRVVDCIEKRTAGAQSLPGNAHRHSCPTKGHRGEPRGRRRAAVRPCGVSESRSGRRDARRHRRGVRAAGDHRKAARHAQQPPHQLARR